MEELKEIKRLINKKYLSDLEKFKLNLLMTKMNLEDKPIRIEKIR